MTAIKSIAQTSRWRREEERFVVTRDQENGKERQRLSWVGSWERLVRGSAYYETALVGIWSASAWTSVGGQERDREKEKKRKHIYRYSSQLIRLNPLEMLLHSDTSCASLYVFYCPLDTLRDVSRMASKRLPHALGLGKGMGSNKQMAQHACLR